jgi:O-antigen/teichoic acid export membrane protein
MRKGFHSALLGGVGTFGAALGWLLSFKALAFWLGPDGVGLFAQFRQIAQTATLASTYGGTNVVVQGLAAQSDETARKRFRAAAARMIAVTALGVALLMLVAAPHIAMLTVSSRDAGLVASIRWLAVAILANAAATYFMAVLNGYRALGRMALAQVSGPIALMFFLVAAWRSGFSSPDSIMAVAFLICFGVTCCVGAWGAARLAIPNESPKASSTDNLPQVFGEFAFSNLVAALSTVLALLIVRSWIIETEGLSFAGLFEAGWTLTFNYTTLFLTACNTVYLPTLTAAVDASERKACMLKTVYLVFGTSVLLCYALVLWKNPLIHLFYSPQFEATGQLLSVLAIAAILRGASWTYGTLMLATRNSRMLATSEILLNVGLLATTRYALDNHPTLPMLGWAFVVPHFIYLVFVVEYARVINPLMLRRYLWPLLILGILPLVCMACEQMITAGAFHLHGTLEGWLFMCAGAGVSLMAFRAYGRVSL